MICCKIKPSLPIKVTYRDKLNHQALKHNAIPIVTLFMFWQNLKLLNQTNCI